MITQLRQAQAQSPVQVPLLLMTDQEGGQVRRLPGAPALSEKQIGHYKTGNFIDQYQRSYSSNPAVASECGQAFITGWT